MRITGLHCEHMPAEAEKYNEFPYCIDTASPRFSFTLEGDGEDTVVKYYKVLVSSAPELLDDMNGDMWDSGLIYSSDTLNIEYKGETLEDKTTYCFRIYAMVGKKAIKSKMGLFTTGIIHDGGWHCGFIGAPADVTTTDKEAEDGTAGKSAPLLRRRFSSPSEISSAKVFATALGSYELYINGEKAGKYRLAPEWTDYTKSIQYQYYDITQYVKQGENVLGAVIGDGWYSSHINGSGRAKYGDTVGLMLNLTLQYKDGSLDEIITDGNWLCSDGAFVYTDNQNGEYYDATKEKDGWCSTGYDDSSWKSVVGVANPSMIGTRFKASVGPQIREMLTVIPVSVNKVKNKYIVDMGQNMVGHISLKLDCKAGTRLVFRHGEMLNDADAPERGCDGEKGTLYTRNLRSAKQTDTYICRGGGETYCPHFTFHGFRYVEITGLDKAPSVDDIRGHVLYSACETTGTINTSNPIINKLVSNALWGQRGNFVGIPTDCPQRDERLGWTGDAQVFCRTACYAMDCYGFYDKYMQDLFEAQKPNGSVTDVVPNVRHNNGWDIVGNGTAAWGDAAFVIPMTLYLMYGDERILEKSYYGMEKYFNMLLKSTNGYLRSPYGYGDWLSIDDDTPKDVLATAYFAYDAQIMSSAAKAIGRKDDAVKYDKLFQLISDAWREAYMLQDDMINGDTQTCYLLALKFKLVKKEQKRAAINHLIRKLKEKDWHLSTGFVGVSYLLPILCDAGYSDVAYKLLLNDTYPSWGYSIKNGATTIWERWNSYTHENGFGDAGMNSFNHYSLGSVVEWMYSYMLGIKPGAPGFSRIIIKPYFDERLDFVQGSYNSASGVISSSWKKREDGFELTVTIPPNTNSKIVLNPATSLCEDGKSTRIVNDGFLCGPGVHRFIIGQ